MDWTAIVTGAGKLRRLVLEAGRDIDRIPAAERSDKGLVKGFGVVTGLHGQAKILRAVAKPFSPPPVAKRVLKNVEHEADLLVAAYRIELKKRRLL